MPHKTVDEIDVTIIVPIYNNASQNLSRCLDSIVEQTHKSIEIILVCDNKLSDSIVICNKYASNDQRISIISLKDSNIGEACNQGISKSKGKYISFMEPNDWAEREMYQLLITNIQRYDADVAITYHYDVDPESNEKKLNKDLIWERTIVDRKLTDKFAIPNFYIKCAHCWGSIYKRDFINVNNIKFGETSNNVDSGYDLSFSFLVFSLMKSFCIIRASLYNHYIPASDIQTEDPYANALNILSRHYYIFDLAKERNIKGDVLQLEIARSANDIIQCYKQLKTLSQRTQYLAKASDLLIKRINLYMENKYLSLRDKDLIKRYAAKPGITAFLDKKNPHIKILRLLINSQFKREVSHIKILNFPILFIKNTPDYSTFNICNIPLRRKRVTRNNDNNFITWRTYYLGIRLFKKDVTPTDIQTYFLSLPIWRRINLEARLESLSKRIDNLPKEFDVLYYASLAADIASIHSKIFPQFKNSNIGKSIAIFGAGPTVNYAPELKKSKIIACNRAYEFFLESGCDYFFGQDYNGIKSYYFTAIEKSTYAFIGRNAHKMHGTTPPEQYREMEKVYSYYILSKFYDFIKVRPRIESFPLIDYFTVVHPALHFALYTNPETIYLIGCDTSTGGYANKNILQFRIHIEDIKVGYEKLKQLRDLEYPDTRIVSVNPIGLKGMFEDVYTQEFLDSEPDIDRTDLQIIKEV